jgi:dCMP deaminase
MFTADDITFMKIAGDFGEFAKCTHRNVGAIIVDRHGQLVGHGFNNIPGKAPRCIDGGCDRGMKPSGEGDPHYMDCESVHAEAGAIWMAGVSSIGATMYVNSYPCFPCMKLILGARIGRLVHKSEEGHIHEVGFAES